MGGKGGGGEEGGGRIGGARTRLGRRKSRLSHILS